MAGDWIKMRGNLWDDPRVSKLCDVTDCGEAQIIGGLYWLWATADQHTEDGIMPGLTLRQIDRKTGIPGFGAALCEIEWVKDDPQGIVIIRFTEHNGSSAKRRCMDAQRKAGVRNVSASDADNMQTECAENRKECGAREREEKEKEKKELKSKAESATASRLPDDWTPSAEEVAFCKAERPDLNPATTASRFRDYWIAQPGAKGRKTDWPATWRNWVRNERVVPAARGSPSYQDKHDKTKAFADALTGRRNDTDHRIIDITPTVATDMD